MAGKVVRESDSLTEARVFCFRHKPTGKLRKIQSDSRRKAMTRIITQAEPTWERQDLEFIWEDTIEHVYGWERPNYWPAWNHSKGFSVKFRQREQKGR